MRASPQGHLDPARRRALLLAAEHRPRPGWRLLQWLILILLSLALAAQWTWYQRDHLAANASLRPWLEQGCERLQLPCRLPPWREPDAVRIHELLVRPAEAPGVRRVSASLINRAAFAQPFPELLLSFRDLDGGLVGQRRLLPTEYLYRPGRERMQPGVGYRLEVRVNDPGPAAISHEIKVLASPTRSP